MANEIKEITITDLKISKDKRTCDFKINGIKNIEYVDWFQSTEAKEMELFEPIDSIEQGACFEREEGWYTEYEDTYATYEELDKEEVVTLLTWMYENHSENGFETMQDMIDENGKVYATHLSFKMEVVKRFKAVVLSVQQNIGKAAAI